MARLSAFEDVPEYLNFVRGGRLVSPQILDEVTHRFAQIGGYSPLRQWPQAQAEALEKQLGIPLFYGMRNWHPFIRETMDRIRESGAERLAAICLAPQLSRFAPAHRSLRRKAAPAGERPQGLLHRAQPAGEGAGRARPLRARMPRHCRSGGRSRRNRRLGLRLPKSGHN
jgi:hypothetical protein